MRVFHDYAPTLEQGLAKQSLAQNTISQTPPGPYNPANYADDSDYNPYASGLQHILIHQYLKTIPCLLAHL